MHVSVNKCELVAEQIVTGVPYCKTKFNPNDFKLNNVIKNEYRFLQDYYETIKGICEEEGKWNEDAMFFLFDTITYMLWYEVNVENENPAAFEYAKRIAYRKRKEKGMEDLAYV